MDHDRYGGDVLAGDWKAPPRGRAVEHRVEIGLVVEDAETGFCGAVLRFEAGVLELEDRHGRVRGFPLGPGYLLDGRPVILTSPHRVVAAPPTRTASGSVAVHGVSARVARGGRVYVEGRHDAELVEQVWGDDLRIEGVVVEYLGGVDDLPSVVRSFEPGADRRLGVLVDHLVPGSKEARIAERVRRGPRAAHVLVVGHPYIDIWQAVRPDRLGLAAWPVIPPGTDWKHGICAALGWPHADQADLAMAWRRIRSSVRDWNDLEPALLGRVEELIDFVTA